MIHLPKEKVSAKLDKKVSFSHHDQELYAFLSQADPDISKIDNAGWTPMHRAIEKDNIEIIKLLIFKSGNANLNFADRQGKTPLTFAIAKGNLDIIELLLKSGADPNFEDKLGWYPITSAIELESIEVIKILKDFSAQ